MKYAKEVDNMCKVNCGASHGCAPDSRGGKMGVLQENQGYLRIDTRDRLVCSAAGRLQADAQCQGRHYRRGADRDAGLFGLEALNTDLVCDAINTAMRELFLQIAYGRTQSAFSEDGLPIGAGLEDLGKGTRSQVGT